MTSRFQDQPAAYSTRGRFFGVPLGDLGFVSSVMMAAIVGVIGFFLATFFAIVGIMIYNGMGHSVNYADSYRLISVPIGCLMLVAGFAFFGTLWLRRKLSGH